MGSLQTTSLVRMDHLHSLQDMLGSLTVQHPAPKVTGTSSHNITELHRGASEKKNPAPEQQRLLRDVGGQLKDVAARSSIASARRAQLGLRQPCAKLHRARLCHATTH